MSTQTPEGFGLYDVAGSKEPLVITHEHAQDIGATEHTPAAAGPKPGSKDALIAQATELGLSTEGTKAELEARIAEANGS